jgi:tetratricopeptide (TPR) repeat protein
MHRRWNGKLLWWIVASLLVAATGVHLVHSHQMHRNASALLRQADRAATQKDFARAAALLQQYLDYEPDDTEALARYAVALDQSAPSAQARFKTLLLLEQVLRRQPGRHDLRRRAIQVAIDMGRIEDAIRHLDYLLSVDSDQGPLQHQLGWCQEALQRYEQSAASFQRAIKQSPRQIESYILLGELLQQRLDQVEEAAKVMDAMVTANPQSWQAYLARARFHYGRADVESAARDILRASELGPEQTDVLLAAAEVALLKGNLTEARNYVYRGLKLQPENERLYRSLSALEMRANHPAEAIACLRLGLEKLPTSVSLHAQLADVYLDLRQAAEVRPLVEWVEKNGKSPGLTDYLKGRLLMLDGQWSAALDHLLSARERLTVASEWASAVCTSLGGCYDQFGEMDKQLQAYRSAVQLNPGNLTAHLELGKTMLACRMVDDAVVELRNLTLLPHAPPETWVVLGRALIGRMQRSVSTTVQWKELDEVLEQAAKATPQAAELPGLRAQRLLLQSQPAAAVALLQKAIGERPDEVQLRIALADLYLRQGKPAEALKVLEQARQHCGPRFLVQQALVRLWMQVGGPQQHQALVHIAQQPGDLTREERIRLLRELADNLLYLGDLATAERVGEQLAELQPKDLRCRVILFVLALAGHRDTDAQRLVAQMRKIEGEEGVYWRAGEVARWIQLARKGDASNLPLARQRLAEIHKRLPEWARAALLEAYVDELEGFTERAIDHYRRAIDLGERSPVIVGRVAQWLFDHSRYADADHVIRKLEETLPLPAETARLGAETALRLFAFSRALDLAAQAVPATARDYRDQLWLAQVQWLARQPSLAEETLRRLVKAEGRIPDVWIALVQHLARTQQQERLPAVFAELVLKMPAERTNLTLARCLEAAGSHDQAEAYFKKALAESPADFVVLRHFAAFHCRSDEFAKAEPYLRQLIDPKGMAPHDLTAWARRQLAQGLAVGDYQQALQLLASNTTSKGSTVEDERAYAFLLASQTAQRAAAMSLVEQSLNKKPLSPDERFQLAQLCDNMGDHAKADEFMANLLAFHGENGQYLAYHIRQLLQRGDLDDARFYLVTLERLEPLTIRTQQLQAAVRKAQKQ